MVTFPGGDLSTRAFSAWTWTSFSKTFAEPSQHVFPSKRPDISSYPSVPHFIVLSRPACFTESCSEDNQLKSKTMRWARRCQSSHAGEVVTVLGTVLIQRCFLIGFHYSEFESQSLECVCTGPGLHTTSLSELCAWLVWHSVTP